MSEVVEWQVGYKTEDGELETLFAGAQSVFSRSRGEELVKKLGPPWRLWHYLTKEPDKVKEN